MEKNNRDLLVSVIIPCYNSEKTLSRALESVLKQTHENIEIIIINSGSTDNTEAVIDSFIEKVNKSKKTIKYVAFNDKRPPGANRNTGIELSKGDYIAFLDSDDYWFSGKIEHQLDMIVANNLDLVGSKTTSDKSFVSGGYLSNVVLVTLKKELIKNRFLTSTVLVKKSSCSLFNDQLTVAEDFDLWCEMLSRGFRLGYNDDVVAYYEKPISSKHLSRKLSAGHKGEVFVLKRIFKKHKIGVFFYIIMRIFYFVKYLRRLLLSAFRKKEKND